MGPWKKAYPAAKVAALNKALSKGAGTRLSDKDIADTIQRSNSYEDFVKKMIETYTLQIELEDFIELCNQELG